MSIGRYVRCDEVNDALYVRDLEKAVEDLSELLETSIEPEVIPSLRQKVTDKTVSVLVIILSALTN